MKLYVPQHTQWPCRDPTRAAIWRCRDEEYKRRGNPPGPCVDVNRFINKRKNCGTTLTWAFKDMMMRSENVFSRTDEKEIFFPPQKKREREKGGMLNAMSYYFIFMWHTVVVSWRLGKFDLMQQQLLYIISARKLDKRRQRWRAFVLSYFDGRTASVTGWSRGREYRR